MNSSKTPALSKVVAFICAIAPVWVKAQEAPKGNVYQVGKASFYGRYFHGRLTANGERFNQNALTAAHRTLPFGTVVRVTRTDNHKSVVVTINDRGPYVKNRVIDLSKGAAASLGMVDKGVSEVVIETLSWGDNKYQHKYPLPEPKSDDFDQPVLASKSKSNKTSAKKSKHETLIPEEYATSVEPTWNLNEVAYTQPVAETEVQNVQPAEPQKLYYGVSEETFVDLPGSDYLDAAYAEEHQSTYVAPTTTPQYEAAKQTWAATTQYSGEAETDLPIQTANEIVQQRAIQYVSPISYTSGKLQQGKAITYYKEHEGQMTSSGEIYYSWDYTAAHESYPFGTMLKVQRRDNNNFVIVKVNDRLSLSSQPMVLLSASAAESLGLDGAAADVVMEPVSLEYVANLGTQTSAVLPKTEIAQLATTTQEVAATIKVNETTNKVENVAAAGPQWKDNEEVAVKIGNYEDVKEAISLVEQLYGLGYNSLVVQSDMTDEGLSFSVIAGPFATPKEAQDYQNLLAQAKIEGKIIPLDKSR